MSCLFIIAGCGIKKQAKLQDLFNQQEILAKFSDLPDAPFQLTLQKLVVSPENHDQLQIFYSTNVMLHQDLIAFYQQQMERLGWELLGQSDLQDNLMHYSKPAQLCSILIAENRVSIYICHKKGA